MQPRDTSTERQEVNVTQNVSNVIVLPIRKMMQPGQKNGWRDRAKFAALSPNVMSYSNGRFNFALSSANCTKKRSVPGAFVLTKSSWIFLAKILSPSWNFFWQNSHLGKIFPGRFQLWYFTKYFPKVIGKSRPRAGLERRSF